MVKIFLFFNKIYRKLINKYQKPYFSNERIIIGFLISISYALVGFKSNIAFWKNSNSALAFLSIGQTVYASACSGATVVETQNSSGTPVIMGSNLTVNLATSGTMTFYSDSACSISITSITISTGTSSSSFYFLGASLGTETITATASSYLTATQSEIFNTNPYIWTGGGSNANWSTNANWSGGAAPNSSTQAIFDSSCVSNCSPLINSNINVSGVRIYAGYSGTITQSPGNALTIGGAGWIQDGGIFVGSNGATASDNIAIASSLKVSSGSFQATAAVLQTSHFNVSGAGSYLANNGTLFFNAGYCNVTSGAGNFKNVVFSCSYVDLNSSSMNIIGITTVRGGYNYYIQNGIILASGDVSIESLSGYPLVGSALIKLTGNAMGQVVMGVAGGIPNLEIDTGTNNVTLSGTISITVDYLTSTSLFKVTSVGALTTTGSTLIFYGGNTSVYPSTATYNNVVFSTGSSVDLNGSTINIAGTTTIDGGYNRVISDGTVNCYGDITAIDVSNYGRTGTAVVVAKGKISGQTISATSATASIPNLHIDSGVNDVTISGDVTVAGSFKVLSVGNLNVAGSTLVMRSTGTLDSGGKNLESLKIVGNDQIQLTNNSLVVNSSVTLYSNSSLDMNGLSLSANSMALNGRTVSKNGGVLTINGSTIGTGSYFGGTVSP